MDPPARYRSPSFTSFETNLLVNLIEKYGHIITTKCTKSVSNIAKERAWQKITKQFNRANSCSQSRPTETLKSKWDNLKRLIAKCDDKMEKSDIIMKVLAIIETHKDTENSLVLQQMSDDSDAEFKNHNMEDIKVGDNGHSSDSENDVAHKTIKARSMNFSPLECQLLINLVKNEKGGVFSNEASKKFRAWRRIAESFNKRFPEKKRTSRVLRTKFQNMKTVARKLNNPALRQKKLIQTIKEEPVFLTDPDYTNDITDYSEIRHVSAANETNDCSDPLKVVLDNCNSDSGIGCGSDTYKIVQDKEVVAIHKQLLNYQLETAKLERKRIQDLIDADTEDKRAKSLINAMKIRTARLEMVRAETKLPMSHPALSYTDNEDVITSDHTKPAGRLYLIIKTMLYKEERCGSP